MSGLLTAALLGSALAALASPARAAVRIEVVSTNRGFDLMAVNRGGAAYGRSRASTKVDYKKAIYRSTNEGATWRRLFVFPAAIRTISPLTTGTLIAAIGTVRESLWRSADRGRTWAKVLRLPRGYRMLTTHSLADDGRYVYAGSYQTFTGSNTTNYVWRSANDGRTWHVVQKTTTHRHIHFVRYDRFNGNVYVGFGDTKAQSGIDVSGDHGLTWRTLCTGFRCKAVDIDFDSNGFAVYGEDVGNSTPYVVRLNLTTGATTTVGRLDCPSWSSKNMGGGVWLVGESREPGGSHCLGFGDARTHLWGSDDGGVTFSDVFSRRKTPAPGYQHMRVYFRFPSGDFPISVTGYGTIVARLAPAGGT